MDAASLRKRLTEHLISEIEDVKFPSITMMNRVEASLETPDELATYAETLLKQVESTKYPSIAMIDRFEGVVDRLEQAERQQQTASQRGDGDRSG
jgi:peptide subunit release factor RF-3